MDKYLEIGDALEIVYQLAQQNALDPAKCDLELIGEARKQQAALAVVHDLIVNEYGED